MDTRVVGNEHIDLAGHGNAFGIQRGGDDPAQQPLVAAGTGDFGGKAHFMLHVYRRLP